MAKYNNLTVGQMEGAINKMGGWDNFLAFLRGEYVLTPVVKATLSLADYWRTRDGLYVHETFPTRVLPYAKQDETSDIGHCDAIDLRRNMYDNEIIAEYLGGMEVAKKNAFTLNQVRAFIDAQRKGGEGPLLANGYANIFYVIGKGDNLFAVLVHWVGDGWHVSGWLLGELDSWCANGRVFRK